MASRNMMRRLIGLQSRIASLRRMSAVNSQSQQAKLKALEDYYGKGGSHYDDLWGDHIHIGYWPHLEDENAAKLDWTEAAKNLNQHMCDLAGINQSSRVCDFGCGSGTNAIEIAEARNCHVTGLDLTPDYIERANRKKVEFPNLQLEFLVGSFTEVPPQLKTKPNEEKFSHIFSQEATCHVADQFDQVCREAHAILNEEGVFVNCEFLVSENGPSQKAKEHFYTRLHYDFLQSPGQYITSLVQNGFDVIDYVDMSHQAVYGYNILKEKAKAGGYKSADGGDLSTHYLNTAECFDKGELVMSTIIAKKKR